MPRQYTPRVPRICEQCSRSFSVPPSVVRVGGGRFCSRPCDFAWKAQRPRPRPEGVILASFWSRVDTSGECWEWQRGKLKQGYGRFKANGIEYKAHRFSYERSYGPIPPGMLVCHHCDNPPCVRPDHLFLGDAQANIDDKISKGRQPLGERIGVSRLTESQVRMIRQIRETEGLTHSQIAERFGVKCGCIGAVLRGETWKHVA